MADSFILWVIPADGGDLPPKWNLSVMGHLGVTYNIFLDAAYKVKGAGMVSWGVVQWAEGHYVKLRA